MKTFFVDCYTSNVEQSQKIDKFLSLLSKSGVCDFIKDIQKPKNKQDVPTYVLIPSFVLS